MCSCTVLHKKGMGSLVFEHVFREWCQNMCNIWIWIYVLRKMGQSFWLHLHNTLHANCNTMQWHFLDWHGSIDVNWLITLGRGRGKENSTTVIINSDTSILKLFFSVRHPNNSLEYTPPPLFICHSATQWPNKTCKVRIKGNTELCSPNHSCRG